MATSADSSIMDAQEPARQRFSLIRLSDRTDIAGGLIPAFANSAK
jgi:hypothetical protein